MILKRYSASIEKLLWKQDLSKLPYWQSYVIKILRILQAVARDLAGGLPTLRAMSLVYTTLLSLVPLLAVSFSVLKGIGAHNEVKPMLLNVLAPMGDSGIQITELLLTFVDNIKVGVLGFVGIALLFYTVISLVQKIERAFNSTWRITTSRNISQRFSDYLSVIMIGPVFIFLAIGITAGISSSSFVEALTRIEPFGSLLHQAGRILPYLIIIGVFTFIYTIIPNTKVHFRSALTGAVISGLLWETTGWLFASFVANSANYTAVYSSFAVLMIFMIWLYLSWLILLTGSSIAYYHQHPERISTRQQSAHLSCRMREKIALLVMFKIAYQFHYDEPKQWTLALLSKSLDISNESMTLIIRALEENKLILRCGESAEFFAPAKSLDHIEIRDIWNAIRSAEETSHLNPSVIKSNETVNTFLELTEDAVNNSMAGSSLLQLVEKQRITNNE